MPSTIVSNPRERARERLYGRGATVSDEMTGNLITYDNMTDVFSVDGDPANPAPGTAGGRVRAVLSPRGAASAPPPAPVAPPTPLRSTPRLGEGR